MLTQEERTSRFKNSASHWANRVQFCRQHLVDRGFIYPANKGPESAYGVWILTPEGRRYQATNSKAEVLLPEEIANASGLVEGAISSIKVNAYERDPEARSQCLAVHGTRCSVCKLDFGSEYSPEFAGFIHVHHLKPIAKAGGEYVVDPVEDLRPVCPNCHAVIHHGGRLTCPHSLVQSL